MDEVMRAKHKRYLDNIYFGAEEIVQTEKNYNIKIRKLGTGLKAALEHNPQIAHFFEKRSDSDLISELNLQRWYMFCFLVYLDLFSLCAPSELSGSLLLVTPKWLLGGGG